MNNPFKKAACKKKYLKIYYYGNSGIGKTWFALGFPKPAVIDLEAGTDFYSSKFEFDVMDTNSFKETLDAVQFLETSKHNYETLVIDTITVINQSLQEGRMEFNSIKAKRDKTESPDFNFRDWGAIKKYYSLLMNKLTNLNMNVVLVAREKNEYDQKGHELVKIGYTGDAEKSTPYITDIRFRMYMKNNKRYAIIEKDRTGTYQAGDVLENPSWDNFKKIVAPGTGENHSIYEDDLKKDASLYEEKKEDKNKTKKGAVTGTPPEERFQNALAMFEEKYKLKEEHLLQYLKKNVFDEIIEEDVVKIGQLWNNLENKTVLAEDILTNALNK